MKRKNRNIATVILIIFAVGFLISYPFNDYFVGELISRCCGAALIGGLADWFGVTAIFKKPLNLNWPSRIFRTDIINRNKDKFISIIKNTIERDIFNKEELKKKVKDHNFAELLLDFLESKEGNIIINEIIDKELAYNYGHELVLKGCENISLDKVITEIYKYFINKGYDEIIINIAIDQLISEAKGKDVLEFIKKIYNNSLNAYEEGRVDRKLTNKLLLDFVLDIKPERAALLIRKKP